MVVATLLLYKALYKAQISVNQCGVLLTKTGVVV